MPAHRDSVRIKFQYPIIIISGSKNSHPLANTNEGVPLTEYKSLQHEMILSHVKKKKKNDLTKYIHKFKQQGYTVNIIC